MESSATFDCETTAVRFALLNFRYGRDICDICWYLSKLDIITTIRLCTCTIPGPHVTCGSFTVTAKTWICFSSWFYSTWNSVKSNNLLVLYKEVRDYSWNVYRLDTSHRIVVWGKLVVSCSILCTLIEGTTVCTTHHAIHPQTRGLKVIASFTVPLLWLQVCYMWLVYIILPIGLNVCVIVMLRG